MYHWSSLWEGADFLSLYVNTFHSCICHFQVLYILLICPALHAGFVVDKEDTSVTRSDAYFRDLFQQTGFQLYKTKVRTSICFRFSHVLLIYRVLIVCLELNLLVELLVLWILTWYFVSKWNWLASSTMIYGHGIWHFEWLYFAVTKGISQRLVCSSHVRSITRTQSRSSRSFWVRKTKASTQSTT